MKKETPPLRVISLVDLLLLKMQILMAAHLLLLVNKQQQITMMNKKSLSKRSFLKTSISGRSEDLARKSKNLKKLKI